MTRTPVETALRPGFRAPFLVVNPKAYLTGDAVVGLAQIADRLAAQFQVSTLFTAQHADLRLVASQVENLTVTAQHMDPMRPGRGMGHILPESLVDAGARAVVLNHAERPLTFPVLAQTIERAREVGLMSVVCADSDDQCRRIATLGPDIMICEPTANIGTGAMDEGEYAQRTTRIVKGVDPDILVVQAAGVSTGEDAARVLRLGADGTGGTTSIVTAADPQAVLTQMFRAVSTNRR